jgi:WD40 repeat protein
VRFLPDGKRAISCSLDCTARLWDLETGTQIHFFEEIATYDPRNMQYGSPRQVWHMDVSEDGKTMVCCLRDGRICVHDVDSGKRIQTLNGPEQFYNSLSINRDATFAITAFGGTLSPKEVDDPTHTPESKLEAQKFWADHALLTGSEKGNS